MAAKSNKGWFLLFVKLENTAYYRCFMLWKRW